MVSRKLISRKSFINTVKLFLIDEIHVLGEESRGPVIEAVVSRMKTLALNLNSTPCSSARSYQDETALRFIAVSATIPNIDDVLH